MTHRSIPATALGLALFLAWAPLTAQEIRGIAVDPDGEPLPAVEVTVVGADEAVVAQAMTDAAGRFGIGLPGPGSYTVVAERLGYASAATFPVAVQRGDVMELVVRLAIEPVELARIEVRLRPAVRSRVDEALARIHLHRRAGIGRSLTRVEIEERNAPTLPALVATMSPLVRTANPLHGPEQIMLQSTRLRPVRGLEDAWLRVCEPTIYLDGLATGGGFDAAALPIDGIEAVELYLGAEAPAMFPDRGDCGGVVLFWTRDGGTDGPRLTMWRAVAGGVTIAAAVLLGLGGGY